MSLDIHSEPSAFPIHGDIRNTVLRRMNSADRKQRLLAIDREEKYLEFIRFVAEDLGFEVRTVTDPDAFAALYEGFDPDVMLIDIMMPECDGDEVARWLSGCDTPKKIIFMSGLRADVSQFSRSLADPDGIHAIHSFRKPFRKQTFGEHLTMALNATRFGTRQNAGNAYGLPGRPTAAEA